MPSLGAALLPALCALASPGCAPRKPPVVPSATATPTDAGLLGAWRSWKTLRSEHRVVVEAHDASGKPLRRALHGVIAVERPDELRLRALGPGGITLFDLLYLDGKVQILRGLADTGDPTFSTLLTSVGRDLAATYDLAPRPASRHVRARDGAVVIEENGRTVRLDRFHPVEGGLAAARMLIDDAPHRYHVEIQATHTALDQPLDPALFQP